MQRFNTKIKPDQKVFERQEIPQIDLESISIEGKRYYWTPNGALYPSVTTVLGSFKGDFIDKWKKRIGEQEAARQLRRASTRGTEMHAICEDYTMNKPNYLAKKMPLSVELFKHMQPILDEHIEVIYGNEIALFSDRLKVAGRCDLFCRFMGVNTIVDFKSSMRDKKEEWIEDYFLQATTYAMMVEEVYKDYKPIFIPQLAIIIGVEEGENKCQLFVEDTRKYRQKVLDKYDLYHSQNVLPDPTKYTRESEQNLL